MVRFLLLRMALAPMKILRRGLQFQVMMKNLNQYLIGMYEAVVHRILGCYVGLRRDPKFLQAFDVVQLSESWAPARIPESPPDDLGGAAACAGAGRAGDGGCAPLQAGVGGAGPAGPGVPAGRSGSLGGACLPA